MTAFIATCLIVIGAMTVFYVGYRVGRSIERDSRRPGQFTE